MRAHLGALALSLLLALGCAVSTPPQPTGRRPAPSASGMQPPRMPRVPRKADPPARPTPQPSRTAAGRPVQARPQIPVVAVEGSNLRLALPGEPRAGAALPPALAALREAARVAGSAAEWRRFADAAAAAGFHAEAADGYRREAAVYRRTGDVNAALVEEAKALEHATSLEVYLYRQAGEADVRRLSTGQRLEPAVGCYLGAFVDRDHFIRDFEMDSQRHGDVAQFAELVGRAHASFFMYRSYGQPFPTKWVEYLKRNGAIPHIAFEPSDLSKVRDDAYLRSFVEDARRTNWPVFIRFAGEMNGEWTRYHGNPAAYRKAFRTVYTAFRRAPLAALLWCPNTVPQTDIDPYYPGDDATDWVGVNFYSVLFEDNDPNRPADRRNPTDMLEYVYRTYSARKPLAIGEWAASHRSALEDVNRPDFASTKIRQLYDSLPTRYPRVKMVNWYDCDNLVKAQPGRQLNNYLLTDLAPVREAYRRATASPWYLGAGKSHPGQATVAAIPLNDGDSANGRDVVDVRVRTFTDSPSVFLRVDGKVTAARKGPGGHRVALAGLKPGRHVVEALVYDGARYVDRVTRTVTVREQL